MDVFYAVLGLLSVLIDLGFISAGVSLSGVTIGWGFFLFIKRIG